MQATLQPGELVPCYLNKVSESYQSQWEPSPGKENVNLLATTFIQGRSVTGVRLEIFYRDNAKAFLETERANIYRYRGWPIVVNGTFNAFLNDVRLNPGGDQQYGDLQILFTPSKASGLDYGDTPLFWRSLLALNNPLDGFPSEAERPLVWYQSPEETVLVSLAVERHEVFNFVVDRDESGTEIARSGVTEYIEGKVSTGPQLPIAVGATLTVRGKDFDVEAMRQLDPNSAEIRLERKVR